MKILNFFNTIIEEMTGRTSSKSSQENSPPLESICGSDKCFTKVDDGIGCDTCYRWYHWKCSRLSKKFKNLYEEHRTLQWVCFQCVKARRKQTKSLHDSRASSIDTDVTCSEITVISKPTELSPVRTKTLHTRLQQEFSELGRRVGNQEIQLNSLQERVLQLTKEILKLEASSEVALGRYRNVVIKGIDEPVCLAPKQRERVLRHSITTLLRIANIPGHVLLKRVFRLGRWTGKADGTPKAPRPVLIEFGNPRFRDNFLAAADRVRSATNGRIKVEPDQLANGRRESIGAIVRTPRLPVATPPRVISSKLESNALSSIAVSTHETYASVVERSFGCTVSPVLRRATSSPAIGQQISKNGSSTRT